MEFVLWLPVLLFVMALMVNYGTMATWRVRGEAVSRHAGWRARWPRTGDTEGRPRVWPQAGASLGSAGSGSLNQLDDPAIRHPVARGPWLYNFVVREHVLDFSRGAYRGVSQVHREYPMLPRLGDYDSGDIDTPLLDNRFQARQMGFPNRYRRIKVLYELPKTPSNLSYAYLQAVLGIFNIPHYEALRVLDRDEDFIKYQGWAPDFHPSAGYACTTDRNAVYFGNVRPLIDQRVPSGIRLGRISRLPRTMTNSFLTLYRRERQRLLDELNSVPPPPPASQAAIRREIADLEIKIGQLEEYLARMDQIEDALRARASAAI